MTPRRSPGEPEMSETSAIKAKIDNLIGIHSRDGYYTAALLTPDDLAEIKDRIAAVEAENDRLRAALKKARDAANTPWSGYSTYKIPVDNEELDALRACARAVRDAFERPAAGRHSAGA
jgi:hypothetical protein